MSFANSEWSEPVNLGAPINSAANEMNGARSPDELSLYFVSTRAGGVGGAEQRVAELRAEFQRGLASLEGRLLARIGLLEGRFGTLEGRLVRWMFLFWAASLGTMLALR